MSESLSDKLKSLGVQLGAHNVPPARSKEEVYPIESVLSGIDLPTVFGPAFLVENRFDIHYLHGDVILSNEVNPHFIAAWARINDLSPALLGKVLFLDTETSGLAGGTGTYAFLVGLGFRSAQGFVVQQIFMRDPGQEPAFLAALDEVVHPFDYVVTFNGKGFDIPLLNARHVMNGVTSPFPAMNHIDLLPLARRLWRGRLASRALKDLEFEILHVPRTQDEVPGWMIPDIYFDYLNRGDARPVANVFYHNSMDILSLAALFNVCSDLLFQPLRQKNVPGLDLVAVAHLFEELDQIDSAVMVYEESLTRGDLPLRVYLETLQRYALLYRRQQRWEEAVGLWEKAAEHGWLDAIIELAKYYEHQAKKYAQAMTWTEEAIAVTGRLDLPFWQKKSILEELAHRRARLAKRLIYEE
jgi:uncharacterized protein YprB with RNaseH-like and TPR domain